MQQRQWVTHLFFLSVGLNVILFALLLFFTLKEHFFSHTLTYAFALPHYIEPMKEAHPEVIALQNLSFRELVPLLLDHTLITPTARRRDLALVIMVNRHHFAIHQALPDRSVEQEKKEGEIGFFIALRDEDFKTIYRFAVRERYPFSPQGLFLQLQTGDPDPLLQAAFAASLPYKLVRQLMLQEGPLLDDQQLIGILLQGNWEIIDNFYQQQKQQVYFSKKERLCFLQKIAKVQKEQIAGRFVERPAIGNLRPVIREPKERTPPPQKYVVQPGDSLWTIAKRHNLSLDKLKEINHMHNDFVRSGQTLQVIP